MEIGSLRFRALALLPTLALIASGPALAQPPERLWRLYAQGLVEQIMGNHNPPGLHLLAPFQTIRTPDLAADERTKQIARYDHLVNWCDAIPSVGPFYERLSDSSLARAYAMYLSSLNYGPGETREQEGRRLGAQGRWVEATRSTDELRQQANNAWTQFDESQQGVPESARIYYDDWYEEYWGPRIGSLAANQRTLAREYAGVLAEGGYAGTLASALADFVSSDAHLVTVRNPTTEKTDRVPDCSLGNLDLVETEELGEASFSSDQVDGEYERESWRVSGGASFLGFIRVGGGGSGSRERRWEQSLSFKVSFRNLVLVPVRRSWLDGNLLRLKSRASDFQPQTEENRTYIVRPDELWSSEGVWPMMTTGLIVGYRPSILVTFGEQEYEEARRSFGGGAGFSFGPFSFSGGGSRDKFEKSWSAANRTLALTPTTDELFVVGVVSDIMSDLLEETDAEAEGRP